MKKAKKFDRKRLKEILESYEGSLHAFDELRPDCYEQEVAGHSLEQLDLLYSEIFAPGQSLEKATTKCPPWPKGSAHAGQPPGETVLRAIHDRFMTEQSLDVILAEKVRKERFMKAVAPLLSKELRQEVDRVLSELAQEVMSAKMQKIPIARQLPSVDRLISGEKLAQRGREGKLKEKRFKLEERRTRVLEKKSQETGKQGEEGGAITKEGWEQVEKDLRLL